MLLPTHPNESPSVRNKSWWIKTPASLLLVGEILRHGLYPQSLQHKIKPSLPTAVTYSLTYISLYFFFLLFPSLCLRSHPRKIIFTHILVSWSVSEEIQIKMACLFQLERKLHDSRDLSCVLLCLVPQCLKLIVMN